MHKVANNYANFKNSSISTNTTNLPAGLYIVATPIGNLQDITFRAIEVLKSVNLILCEDTRVTQRLLHYYGIRSKLWSYGNHNLKNTTAKVIEFLLYDQPCGQSVALVSDAGTPLISDPGSELIQSCYKNNIKVTTIPGACAVVSALTLGGVDTSTFYFGGFFANTVGLITKQLTKVLEIATTSVFYVAANKLVKVLPIIMDVLGKNQTVIIVREITKLFEEVINQPAELLLQQVSNQPLRGEVVLLLPYNTQFSQIDTLEQIQILQSNLDKYSFKEAITATVEFFKHHNKLVSKKELYNLALSLKKSQNDILDN